MSNPLCVVYIYIYIKKEGDLLCKEPRKICDAGEGRGKKTRSNIQQVGRDFPWICALDLLQT